MAFLCKTYFRLKPNDLGSVFAHIAIHGVVVGQDLSYPLGECLDHLWVVVEVTGLDEIDLRERFGDQIREAVYAVDQDAGEEEIGENDNPLEAQFGDMFQARLHQREGDAGIADLAPSHVRAFH